MKDVLILCTVWTEDYWEIDRIAPYHKYKKYLSNIQHLKSELPVAGIGVYTKSKQKDLSSSSPCFLIIKAISEEKGGPQFDIHFVSKMEGITSSKFLDEIATHGLFFSIPKEKILKVLGKLDITPPREWMELLEERTWQDWVGRRFHEILEPPYSNIYEDRVAEIFKALGFEVEQMGYRKKGEHPDGIIYSSDFAVVYDCKNIKGYFPDKDDKRAMTSYFQMNKKRIKEKQKIDKVYFAFIAHSYRENIDINDVEKETSTKGLLLMSESLLYLIYKKLFLGNSFLLAEFERLISGRVVTKEVIEEVYRVG